MSDEVLCLCPHYGHELHNTGIKCKLAPLTTYRCSQPRGRRQTLFTKPLPSSPNIHKNDRRSNGPPGRPLPLRALCSPVQSCATSVRLQTPIQQQPFMLDLRSGGKMKRYHTTASERLYHRTHSSLQTIDILYLAYRAMERLVSNRDAGMHERRRALHLAKVSPPFLLLPRLAG